MAQSPSAYTSGVDAYSYQKMYNHSKHFYLCSIILLPITYALTHSTKKAIDLNNAILLFCPTFTYTTGAKLLTGDVRIWPAQI